MTWIRLLTKFLYALISVAAMLTVLLATFLYEPTLQHKLAEAIIEQTFHNDTPAAISGDMFGDGLEMSRVQIKFKGLDINAQNTKLFVAWTPKRLYPLIKLEIQELTIQPSNTIIQQQTQKKTSQVKSLIPLAITDIYVTHLKILEPWTKSQLEAHKIHIENKRSLTAIEGLFLSQQFHLSVHWHKNFTPERIVFRDNTYHFELFGQWHKKNYTLKDAHDVFNYTLKPDQTWTLQTTVKLPSIYNHKNYQIDANLSLKGKAYELLPNSKINVDGKWHGHPLKLVLQTPFKQHAISATYGNNKLKIMQNADITHIDLAFSQLHLINPNFAGDLSGSISKQKKWHAQLKTQNLSGLGARITKATFSIEGVGKKILDASVMVNKLQLYNQDLHQISLTKKHNHALTAEWMTDKDRKKSKLEVELNNNKVIIKKSPHLFNGWYVDRDVELSYLKPDWTSNHFCVRHANDKICLKINFNPNNYTWQTQYNVQIKNLSFDSSTLFDQLTATKLNVGQITGKGTLFGKKLKYTRGSGQLSFKQIDGYVINIVPSFFLPIDYYFNDGSLNLSLKKNSIDIDAQTSSKQGKINIQGSYRDGAKIHIVAPEILIKQNQDNYLTGSIDLSYETDQTSKLRGDIIIKSGHLKPMSLTGVEYLPDDIIIQTEGYTESPLHTNINLIIKPDIIVEYIGLYGILSGTLRILESPEDGTQVSGRLSMEKAYFGIFGRSIKLKVANITYYNTTWQNPIVEFSAQKPISDSTISTAHVRVFGSPSQLYTEIYSIPRGLSDIELITHLFSKTDLSIYKHNDPTLTKLMSGSEGQRALVNFLSTISQIESKLPIDYIAFNTTRVDSSGEQVVPTSVTLGTKLAQKLLLKVRLHVNQTEEDSIILAYNIRPNLALELSSTAEGKGLFFIWNGFWD